ncbi:MAG: TerB family tellurite resistance protein [Pseudomonadota bacterium]
MHILLGLLGIIGALALWYWRIKALRDAAGELGDAAGDVRLAVRRFGYKRRHKTHPADCVEDARLAASGIALAIAGCDGPLSRDELSAMAAEAKRVFGTSQDESTEIAAFGRWVQGQCKTPEEVVRRLSRIVRKEAGADGSMQLIDLVPRVAKADGQELTERQMDLINQLHRELSA